MSEEANNWEQQLSLIKIQVENYKTIVEEAEKRNKNATVATNLFITGTAISAAALTGGIIMLSNNQDAGKYFLIGGGIGLAGIYLTYNFGHLAIKIW